MIITCQRYTEYEIAPAAPKTGANRWPAVGRLTTYAISVAPPRLASTSKYGGRLTTDAIRTSAAPPARTRPGRGRASRPCCSSSATTMPGTNAHRYDGKAMRTSVGM